MALIFEKSYIALSTVVKYISKYASLTPRPLDISDNVVLQGKHYIAIGEHSDLWEGKISDKKVAVKVLRGGSSSNPDFRQKFKERLVQPALNWQQLKHPNVCEFIGLAFNFGYMPALILAFYENGNVVEYLKVKEEDDEARLDMVIQISRGLEYLHGQSIIHGDLRGSNVLIDEDGRPRICDYGLAFIIEPSEFTSIKTAGACRWTAPEIMNPPEDDTTADDSLALFTKESDVYAFAMTCIEIFTGNIPFSQKKNDSSVIFYVLGDGRPELPASMEKIGSLVQECWAREPKQRPTSRAITERLRAMAPDVGNTFEAWFGRFVVVQ